ncbi:MAG: ATP-binding cassette domain-containing protein [Planctomycetes bacterium]|nr:ATP-binding cassette domain-containing protein [Planctomycetota bacterium]
MIETRGLSKIFHVHKKDPGLWGSVRSLFRRRRIEKHAVREVTVRVDEGEIVGLVGANGAGKTTLVKMLAGIIHPTSGEARVLGHVPWERDDRLRRRLALIMGQKAQLWWDLPAADGFLLLKEIYRIPDAEYRATLDYLTTVLEIGKELNVQVRRLSLGERMKMELIAALLHRPRVVFLDEPTIGLDLSAQRAIRDFILAYREEHAPAMLLTSHYMEDIPAPLQAHSHPPGRRHRLRRPPDGGGGSLCRPQGDRRPSAARSIGVRGAGRGPGGGGDRGGGRDAAQGARAAGLHRRRRGAHPRPLSRGRPRHRGARHRHDHRAHPAREGDGMSPRLFARVMSLQARTHMSYRLDFWIQAVVGFVGHFALAWFLWGAMFRESGRTEIAGYDFTGMIFYYLSVLLLGKLVAGREFESGISGDIYQGTLTRYLLFPARYLPFKYAQHLGSMARRRCRSSSSAASSPWRWICPPACSPGPLRLARMGAALLLGNLLHFLLSYCIQLVAFWADNVWSLEVGKRFIITLLGGFTVPLAVFPDAFQGALQALPFRFLFDFPVRVMLGQIGPWEWMAGMAAGSLWCIAFWLLSRWLWWRGQLQYTGVGI